MGGLLRPLFKTARTATRIVASSDADPKSKVGAYRVCDGVDDQEEIQAAIDSLPVASVTEETFTTGSREQFDSFDADPPAWAGIAGDETITRDTADKKEGTASLSVSMPSAASDSGIKKTGLTEDWSAYNIAIMWGKVSLASRCFRLEISDGTNWERFWSRCSGGTDWEEFSFDLRDPAERSGVVNRTSITEVRIVMITGSTGQSFKVDDFKLNKWIALANDGLKLESESIGSYVRGTDYLMDYGVGEILALPAGGMAANTAYTINYQYYRGGKIILSEGKFSLNSRVPVNSSRVSIKGAGINATILEYVGALNTGYVKGGGLLSIPEGRSHITISDLTSDAKGKLSYAVETWCRAEHSTYDIHFERIKAKDGGDDCISISNKAVDVWIRDCLVVRTQGAFSGREYAGIEVEEGSRNVWVIHNVIDSILFEGYTFYPVNIHWHGGYPLPHGVRVIENKLYPIRNGIKNESSTHLIPDNRIADNF